jgi:hypothetical protein
MKSNINEVNHIVLISKLNLNVTLTPISGAQNDGRCPLGADYDVDPLVRVPLTDSLHRDGKAIISTDCVFGELAGKMSPRQMPRLARSPASCRFFLRLLLVTTVPSSVSTP